MNVNCRKLEMEKKKKKRRVPRKKGNNEFWKI